MLALRFSLINLMRQKRRTLITSLTLMVGLIAVNLFQGYQTDTVESLAETAAYGEMLGHLSVMKEGALTKGKIDEITYMFDGPQLVQVMAAIKEDPDVALAAARMNLSGLVSNGNNSIIFIAVAMDPAVLADFQKKFDWRGEGSPLAAGDVSDGQVAKGLAEIMEVGTGDFLTLFSTTVKNQMNAVDVEVKATYPTGVDRDQRQIHDHSAGAGAKTLSDRRRPPDLGGPQRRGQGARSPEAPFGKTVPG